jgi:hypothetical protein
MFFEISMESAGKTLCKGGYYLDHEEMGNEYNQRVPVVEDLQHDRLKSRK